MFPSNVPSHFIHQIVFAREVREGDFLVAAQYVARVFNPPKLALGAVTFDVEGQPAQRRSPNDLVCIWRDPNILAVAHGDLLEENRVLRAQVTKLESAYDKKHEKFMESLERLKDAQKTISATKDAMKVLKAL